jgi:hypothetical protein
MKVESIGLLTNASPVVPSTGQMIVYSKGDGKVYTRTNESIEQEVAYVDSSENIQSFVSDTTVTPNADTDNYIDITGLASDLTIANATGTPRNFQKLIIRIKDNGSARVLTFDTSYVAGGVDLPTTTTASKIMNLGFIYNTANALNKWQLVAYAQEA